MNVSKLRTPESVAVCQELGISAGQTKKGKPIVKLVRELEMSDVRLLEDWELIQEWDGVSEGLKARAGRKI